MGVYGGIEEGVRICSKKEWTWKGKVNKTSSSTSNCHCDKLSCIRFERSWKLAGISFEHDGPGVNYEHIHANNFEMASVWGHSFGNVLIVSFRSALKRGKEEWTLTFNGACWLILTLTFWLERSSSNGQVNVYIMYNVYYWCNYFQNSMF